LAEILFIKYKLTFFFSATSLNEKPFNNNCNISLSNSNFAFSFSIKVVAISDVVFFRVLIPRLLAFDL